MPKKMVVAAVDEGEELGGGGGGVRSGGGGGGGGRNNDIGGEGVTIEAEWAYLIRENQMHGEVVRHCISFPVDDS